MRLTELDGKTVRSVVVETYVRRSDEGVELWGQKIAFLLDDGAMQNAYIHVSDSGDGSVVGSFFFGSPGEEEAE
jgi:hypothetical protein